MEIGTYAATVTVAALGASCVAATRRVHLWPAFALLVSAFGARLAEWGPFPTDDVMMASCLLCLFIVLHEVSGVAYAVATLYALRLAAFVPVSAGWYVLDVAWEFSNSFVLLQAALVAVGALYGGHPVRRHHVGLWPRRGRPAGGGGLPVVGQGRQRVGFAKRD